VIALTARLTPLHNVALSPRKPLSHMSSMEQQIAAAEWVLSALPQQGPG